VPMYALAALLLAGTIASAAQGADGILLREELVRGSNYGHLKFPAITEDSLFTDEPVLKDSSSGDIIDYYGALDHDPLGMDEVARQRRQALQDDLDND
ncbi:MAG: hypothetical protein ACREQW_16830, partial [Candidatus Binatia bacterium]